MKTDAVNAATSKTDGSRAVRGESELDADFAGGPVRKTLAPAASRKRIGPLSRLAKQKYAEKRFADVQQLCDQILALDPDNFLALRYAALIHTRNGDIDAAEVFWRKLFVLAPDKIESAVNLSRTAQARGQWDLQAEFADLALREDRERADALRLAIQARVKARRFAELSDLLPRLYLKEPDRASAYLRGVGGPEQLPALAAAFMRIAGTWTDDAARAAFMDECGKTWLVGARRAIDKNEESLTGHYLRAVLVIDPASREAIDGLAVLSRESLIDLRKAIAKRDRALAISHARAATEINPALLEAWFDLARLTEDEDPDSAAEYFRACARLAPRDPSHLIRAGRALTRADKPAEALIAYLQSAQLASDDRRPLSAEIFAAIAALRLQLFERAQDLTNEGRHKEARVHFGAAVSGARTRAAPRPVRAFLGNMSETLKRGFRKDDPGPIAWAEQFLAVEPDNEDILNLLGTALVRGRKFDRAKAIFQRLTQIRPDGLTAHVQLARCCHALGHREDGVAAATVALGLDSTTAMAHEAAALFGIATTPPDAGLDESKS